MEKALTTLTGKKVRVGIKNGMTVDDFCKRYSCEPAELNVRIGKLFTVNDDAKKIWGEILANEKKPKAKVTAVEEVVGTSKVADNATEGEATDDTPPRAPTLDELKSSESELSDKLIEMEKAYKACYQDRDEGRKKYRSLLDDIKSIKKQFDAKVHDAEVIIRRDDEIVGKMNGIWTEYRDKRAALEAIRAQIEEMSKIVLCVYKDYEIAPFDESLEIKLDDRGHDDLFKELREQEAAEDFRLKDIKVVARLIRIVANLGSPVEIIFDDEEVRKAYEALKST